MRRSAVVLVALVLVAGCGEESTEVEATSSCGPLVHTDDGSYVSECVVEATDERVSGPEVQTVFLDFDDDSHESGTFTGEFEIVGPDGSWSGTASGTFSAATARSHAEMVGSGGYEGLTFTFESVFDEDSSADGAGVATRTGVITRTEG